MHIKEGLVFNKNTGNLVGFVDLGDFNNDFMLYANLGSQIVKVVSPWRSVLFIMVRGLTSNQTFPYARFPVDSPLFWEAVDRLE